MSVLPYAIGLSVSGVVSGLLASYAWSQRGARGSPELARLSLAVTIWASCAALEALATSLSGKLLWAGVAYIGGATVPPLCLMFVQSYLDRRLRPQTAAILFIVPALTAVFALTNQFHRLMYTRVSLVETWAGMQGQFEHGPWYFVHTVYSYALVGGSLAWLWWSTRRAQRVRAMQARWLIVAFLVPLAGNLLYVLSPAVASGIDLTPVGFTLSGCALAVTIYHHRLMRLGPLARSVLFEQMEDGVLFLDTELGLVDANAAAASMLDLSRSSVGGIVDDLPHVGSALGALCRSSTDEESELELEDGRWLRVRCSRLDDATGRSFGRLVVIQEVTRYRRAEAERREIDRQLQHTQKLESLGVLAGGIAHDFNNLLTVILGRADLALTDSPRGSPTHAAVGDIVTASRRAAELCRQMLAYSGRGLFIIGDLDLNELVEEMASLIQTSVSKKAYLTLDLSPELPLVRGDATQLRQVILNLITNASEALGERPGGIDVKSRAVNVSSGELREMALGSQVPAGEYVSLEVRDSGSGMPPEVADRMFEPFFTTKFTGRGLGLSAVLGIVRGHHGAISVRSQTGTGTHIRVLLPALAGSGRIAASSTEKRRALWAVKQNTVLLVDDEEMVRSVGTAMLERLGYDVLVADEGHEAVRLYLARSAEISCVIMDLSMPGLDSNEALRAMRQVNPRLPAIVSSGFSEPDAESRLTEPVVFLQKPYELAQLASILEAVLRDASAERRSSREARTRPIRRTP